MVGDQSASASASAEGQSNATAEPAHEQPTAAAPSEEPSASSSPAEDPAASTSAAAVAEAAGPETYTVQPGDTLSGIAQQVYGDAGSYMRIFKANRDKLDNPDMIQPGQELVIPR